MGITEKLRRSAGFALEPHHTPDFTNAKAPMLPSAKGAVASSGCWAALDDPRSTAGDHKPA